MKKSKLIPLIISISLFLCSCNNDSMYTDIYYNPQNDEIIYRSDITTADTTVVPDFTYTEVGDIITFGSFEQDYTSSNGEEDIEWLVLDKKSDRILVISKNILKCQSKVNELWSWDISPMRKYLNDEFFNYAFTANQQKIILTVTNSTPETIPGIDSGEDTQDRIFLLSNKEADKYFSSDDARKSAVTLSTKADGCRDWWLLRTQGIGPAPSSGQVKYWCIQFVDENGTINEAGCHVEYAGLRPAMWISTKNQ